MCSSRARVPASSREFAQPVELDLCVNIEVAELYFENDRIVWKLNIWMTRELRGEQKTGISTRPRLISMEAQKFES